MKGENQTQYKGSCPTCGGPLEPKQDDSVSSTAEPYCPKCKVFWIAMPILHSLGKELRMIPSLLGTRAREDCFYPHKDKCKAEWCVHCPGVSEQDADKWRFGEEHPVGIQPNAEDFPGILEDEAQ